MADWLDGIWVGLGAFLAVVGAVAFEEWKTWRDGRRNLSEGRGLVRKLVHRNEEMARQLINAMNDGRREEQVYFLFSAWHSVQIEFAKRAPIDEYIAAAGLFEEARYLDEAWRVWRAMGDETQRSNAVSAAQAHRDRASRFLKKRAEEWEKAAA